MQPNFAGEDENEEGVGRFDDLFDNTDTDGTAEDTLVEQGAVSDHELNAFL